MKAIKVGGVVPHFTTILALFMAGIAGVVRGQTPQGPVVLYVTVDTAAAEGAQVVTKLNPGGASTGVRVDWSTNGVDFMISLATVFVDGTSNVLVTNWVTGVGLGEQTLFRVAVSNAVQDASVKALPLRTGVTLIKNDAATLIDALTVPMNPIRFAADAQFTPAAVIFLGGERTIDGEGRSIVFTKFGFETFGDIKVRNLTFQDCLNYTTPPSHVHYGGAIRNYGQLELKACRFLRNTTPGFVYYNSAGGAISNGGRVGDVDYHQGVCLVEDCYFEGNVASTQTYASGFGGALYNAGTMTVSRCTFTNNVAGPSYLWAPDGAHGGAIGNSGSIEVVNCTFVENKFGSTPSVLANRGSAVYSSGSALIRFCTFTGNNESTIAGTNLSIYGSIVVAASGAGAVAFENSPTDLGYNIASDVSGNLTAAGSMQGVDAKLEGVGENGGATPTVALKAGSPALDAISTANGVVFDQRGVPRPQGTGVDIGAVEMIDESKAQLILFSDNRFSGRVAVTGTDPKRVDATSDFINWFSLGTLTPVNGLLKFEEAAGNSERRFYRIAPTQ